MKSYTDGILVFSIEILNDYLFYLASAGNNKPFRVTPSTSSIWRTSIDNSVGFSDFFLFCVHLFVYVWDYFVGLYICTLVSGFGSEQPLQQQSTPACSVVFVCSLAVLWNICFLSVQSSLVVPAWLGTTTLQYNCSTSDNISKYFNI